MTHTPNHTPHHIEIEQPASFAEIIPVVGGLAIQETDVTSVEYPEGAGGALVDRTGNRVIEFPGAVSHEEDAHERAA